MPKRVLAVVSTVCLLAMTGLSCTFASTTASKTLTGSETPESSLTIETASSNPLPTSRQPINPWPTEWPSETVTLNGTVMTLTSHPPNPMLSLDTSPVRLSASAGQDTAPVTRYISATYDDTPWTVTTDVNWLVVSPKSGIAWPIDEPLTIFAKTVDLAPGVYSGNAIIKANVFNSPLKLPVILTVF